MTVKIVRLINGEDVIADVKEVHKDKETPGAVAYVFERPYTVQIIENSTEMLFESPVADSQPKKINDLDLKFYPYVPLSVRNSVVCSVPNVVLIYDPHPKVMDKYRELITAIENDNERNFEVDYSHQPPVSGGEGDGTGGGTESVD
jgi:hypothetical protein